MGAQLCGSDQGHVHIIRHEISEDSNCLKTTYNNYDGGKFVQNSVYPFERKRRSCCSKSTEDYLIDVGRSSNHVSLYAASQLAS